MDGETTADPLVSEAMRRIGARRRRFEHVCPVCGTAFTGVNKAVYCSAMCRQRAFLAAHPGYRKRQTAVGGQGDGSTI